MEPISIPQAIATLPGPWQPTNLATVNEAIVRVVRLHGEFPFHVHAEEDELYLCWDGSFRIELEGDDPVVLSPGEFFVVPKGVRHRPVADEPAHAVLVERAETRQYGS